MQAKVSDLGRSSEMLYLFNCERRDFGERHFVHLLGRVLHMYENGSRVVHTPREDSLRVAQVPHVS